MLNLKSLPPFLIFVLVFGLFSCAQKKQVSKPEELGKIIFEHFKKQEKKKIVPYLISKEETRTIFKNSPDFNSLSKDDQDKFVLSTYERNKSDALNFIDFYTNKEYKEANALQSGEFMAVSSVEKEERGTTISGIQVIFVSDGKKYALILKAAKIDNYWKLLYWIEVSPLRG